MTNDRYGCKTMFWCCGGFAHPFTGKRYEDDLSSLFCSGSRWLCHIFLGAVTLRVYQLILDVMHNDSPIDKLYADFYSGVEDALTRLRALVEERGDPTDQGRLDDIELFWGATRKAMFEIRPGKQDIDALHSNVNRLIWSASSDQGQGQQGPDVAKALSALREIIVRLAGKLPAPQYMNVEHLNQSISGMVDVIFAQRERQLDQLKKESTQVLQTLKEHNQRADKLLAAVGEKGGSLGYEKHAEAGRKARRFWQVITILGFVGWLLLSAFTYLLTFSMSPSAGLALRNLAVGLPFVLLCGFGVMQVSRSSKVETSNRRLELQLLAMEPLMAGLSDKQRNDVRKLVIPQFLSNTDQGSAHNPADDAILVTRVLSIVEQLAKKTS